MTGLLRRLGWVAAAVLGAALLASCASSSTPQDLPLGSTEAQVIARMGPPTGRYTLENGGTRLEFARGPQGRATYMVDFDAAGGSTVWDQVLTPQRRGLEAHRPPRKHTLFPAPGDHGLELPLSDPRMPVVSGVDCKRRQVPRRRAHDGSGVRRADTPVTGR